MDPLSSVASYAGVGSGYRTGLSASGMISASSAGRLNAITPPPTASLSAFKNLPVYIWIIEYITHRKFISPV
jgi:hypothetical protein